MDVEEDPFSGFVEDIIAEIELERVVFGCLWFAMEDGDYDVGDGVESPVVELEGSEFGEVIGEVVLAKALRVSFWEVVFDRSKGLSVEIKGKWAAIVFHGEHERFWKFFEIEGFLEVDSIEIERGGDFREEGGPAEAERGFLRRDDFRGVKPEDGFGCVGQIFDEISFLNEELSRRVGGLGNEGGECDEKKSVRLHFF